MKLNPLLDKDFLVELDKIPLKEVYAEVIALNSNDEVLETIEGHVTAGTVNVDGASAVRRTCTLTIVADELNIHEYYWGLHTKFKLSLGVKNEIDDRYPDIIWFKQGTFVISNFTTSQALSNYTINIQGKDKMTLLNGEMGGMITGLTHDFGKILINNKNGDTTKEDLLLKDIIIGAVHQFANEPLFNIIINDLDDEGLELLEYRGDQPFYLLINNESQEVFNISFDGNAEYTDVSTNKLVTLSTIPVYNPLFELEQSGVVIKYTVVKDTAGNRFSVAKMEYGKTAGYRMTPLTFAGDLILNIGDPVTSMLDKIVQMLGQYEYFYDIDGKFIFQRKKTFFNSSWNNMITPQEKEYIVYYRFIPNLSLEDFNKKIYYYKDQETGEYIKATEYNQEYKYYEGITEDIIVEPSAYTSAISYSFEDGQLIASYQNNPNLANIKNDFVVWGTKKSVTGQEIPVHMRYAIDKKPSLFVNYKGVHYTTLSDIEINKLIENWYRGENPPFYVKKPNPNGLSEDWWDIFDWAEYYKLSTGDYPNRVMGEYLREGGVTFTREEMYAMFPKGSRTNEHFVGKPIYLFDVEADGTLGNTGHGTGCTAHKYKDYFIDQLGARGATAYLYKPELPVDINSYEIPKLEIHSNLDWREIIYQMAIDYRENHDEEDFYVKISTTNYGNYDRGVTGYEQYYADMEGFWRQLYDPEYVGTYEPIFISRKTYDEHPENYRFAKDKYIPCTQDMPYRASAGYYMWIADENYKFSMQLVKDLTKASYEANFKAKPEDYIQYYIIDPEEPYEIVDTLIVEPFHASREDGIGLGYYRQVDNTYEEIYIAESTYEAAPRNYWQIKSKEFLPCAKVLPFSAAKVYCNELGEAIMPRPTQEEYEKDPWKFYYKSYGYIQCKETDNYNDTITYYKLTSSPAIDEVLYAPVKILNDEIFSRNKTQYYIRETESKIFRCVELLREQEEQDKCKVKINLDTGDIVYYDWNTYVELLTNVCSLEEETLKMEGEKLGIDNSEKIAELKAYYNEKKRWDYQARAYEGILYYEQKYYECCEHRISYNPAINFYHKVDDVYDKNTGWVKEVSQNPESLNFWFDFLDENSELQKFGCHSIGNRPKGVNDNQVKAIYFRETPTVIFVDSDIWEEVDRSKLGYTYLQLPPNFVSLFSVSAQGKSAKTAIDDLIYKHACGAESITISVLPIYHLEPNTRIFVRHDESGINGEYILTRYSLNLGTGNNMSISASKAVDRLY